MPRMPCSGLKSATSFTSLAPRTAGRSCVAPSRARPVWLVTRPTRLPLQRRETLRARARRARSSTGGARRAAPARRPARRSRARSRRRVAHGVRRHVGQIAEAATVATRARSGVTSPLPSGWTRFDRNTTNTLRRRIDPERRAGEPGVPERSERQQLAAIRRVRRVDVPAEAAHVRIAGRRRRRRHLRDRERRQDARAVVAARRRAACGRRSTDRRRC